MAGKEIRYIGVDDHEIDLFEGQYRVPRGMAYNSYAIVDDKIAILDTVDARFTQVWLDNIRSALGEQTPDFLIVQHMEPDHSGSILRFMQAYPDTQIVSSARSFTMIQNFFGVDFGARQIAVGDGDALSLGKHELTFITAPMVHWPEVIMTYDSMDRALFSADAFGKFGALDAQDGDWVTEARRYYIGIVGKYGASVQAVLKKLAGLDIQAICPLHGPVLTEDLSRCMGLYHTWSTYAPEEEGIVIAYTSVYGNTKQAALRLAEALKGKGRQPVAVYDLARCDMAAAVADAFRYSKLVLAATTYNGGLFPFMREFIHHLTERGFANRTVAFVENGSWAPAAIRAMKAMLEAGKNITWAETAVTIRSALDEDSAAQLAALADELCRPPCGGQAPDSGTAGT